MEQLNWPNAIRTARKFKKMTMFDVAMKSKGRLKEGRLARLETGRQEPSAEDLKVLSRVLGVKAEDLKKLAERDPVAAALATSGQA